MGFGFEGGENYHNLHKVKKLIKKNHSKSWSYFTPVSFEVEVTQFDLNKTKRALWGRPFLQITAGCHHRGQRGCGCGASSTRGYSNQLICVTDKLQKREFAAGNILIQGIPLFEGHWEYETVKVGKSAVAGEHTHSRTSSCTHTHTHSLSLLSSGGRVIYIFAVSSPCLVYLQIFGSPSCGKTRNTSRTKEVSPIVGYSWIPPRGCSIDLAVMETEWGSA